MAGRDVYTMAIQMPNVTSYSGSWLVWFAERGTAPTGHRSSIRPPEPTRKVDPRYIADTQREGIEGSVRLTAIIRKDGSVDGIELLKHLDARLDSSAEEALSKWHFTPAARDGEAIDVDAVFEVPFRLAPKAAR
jgi:TonB family protein